MPKLPVDATLLCIVNYHSKVQVIKRTDGSSAED